MPKTLAWSLQHRREGRSLYISVFHLVTVRWDLQYVIVQSIGTVLNFVADPTSILSGHFLVSDEWTLLFSVATALQDGFLPYCEPVFKRCVSLVEQEQFSHLFKASSVHLLVSNRILSVRIRIGSDPARYKLVGSGSEIILLDTFLWHIKFSSVFVLQDTQILLQLYTGTYLPVLFRKVSLQLYLSFF